MFLLGFSLFLVSLSLYFFFFLKPRHGLWARHSSCGCTPPSLWLQWPICAVVSRCLTECQSASGTSAALRFQICYLFQDTTKLDLVHRNALAHIVSQCGICLSCLPVQNNLQFFLLSLPTYCHIGHFPHQLPVQKGFLFHLLTRIFFSVQSSHFQKVVNIFIAFKLVSPNHSHMNSPSTNSIITYKIPLKNLLTWNKYSPDKQNFLYSFLS